MESLQPSPTIVEQVYRTILDAICDGRLEPGERLTQESVAQKLAVSRQPVGQALLLLKQQKFLSEAGRRGLMVAPLDRQFMRWIYELRLGIEPLAAALAAPRANPESIARGEQLIQDGQRAVRDNSIWVEHEQILRAIAAHDGEAAAGLVRSHLQNAALNVQLVVPADTRAPKKP